MKDPSWGTFDRNKKDPIQQKVDQLTPEQKKTVEAKGKLMLRIKELKEKGDIPFFVEILGELKDVTNRELVRERRDLEAVQERISDINSIERLIILLENGDTNLDLYLRIVNGGQK